MLTSYLTGHIKKEVRTFRKSTDDRLDQAGLYSVSQPKRVLTAQMEDLHVPFFERLLKLLFFYTLLEKLLSERGTNLQLSLGGDPK